MNLTKISNHSGLFSEAGEAPTGGGGSPGVIGGAPSGGDAPVSNPVSTGGEVNAYEATFGKYFNSDGSAKEGWSEQLPAELGIDEGRRAHLARQTSFESLIKGLASAQDHIERRDGNGKFVPSEGDALTKYRSENGIPVNLDDPQDSYDFTAGLEEGAVLAHPELAKEIAPLLQEANVTKEQGRKIAEVFNAHQKAEVARLQEEMENGEQEHMNKVVSDFKKEWGHEFEQKSEQVGRMHQAYQFDVDDPRDLAALSNPKVVRALADLAVASRLSPVTPDQAGGSEGPGAQSAVQQARTIMKDNPGWRNDSALRQKVEMLHKQAASQNARR